jgi:mRNA interferase MazF
MTAFQRGQLWLVNFDPSFGHEYQKVRSALIIEHDRYIPLTSLLTVIPISSQLTKRTTLDVLIPKDAHNRLMKDSLGKVMQISSFDKRRFIKYIGILTNPLITQIDQQIQQFLFGKVLKKTTIKKT